MATRLNVPASQRPAVQELARLSETAYVALRDSLTGTNPHSDPSVLIEQTSKAVFGHTKLAGQIVGTVIGLRSLVDAAAMSVDDVAQGIATDIFEKGDVQAESKALLSNRLAELLAVDSVIVTAKAFSLVAGDAAPFSSIRIVSDVRPIFKGSDGELDFCGSVIVHQLKIELTNEQDDLHCVLTTSDLYKVKRAVERAIEKDRRLRRTLTGTAISPLDADSIREDAEG